MFQAVFREGLSDAALPFLLAPVFEAALVSALFVFLVAFALFDAGEARLDALAFTGGFSAADFFSLTSPLPLLRLR
jgi:hypothetical protein